MGGVRPRGAVLPGVLLLHASFISLCSGVAVPTSVGRSSTQVRVRLAERGLICSAGRIFYLSRRCRSLLLPLHGRVRVALLLSFTLATRDGPADCVPPRVCSPDPPPPLSLHFPCEDVLTNSFRWTLWLPVSCISRQPHILSNRYGLLCQEIISCFLELQHCCFVLWVRCVVSPFPYFRSPRAYRRGIRRAAVCLFLARRVLPPSSVG